MSTERIVFASNNAGKLREIRNLLDDLPFDISAQSELNCPEIEETGLSFIENALIKARNACRHCGCPGFADDSGLVVAALGGAPGILSARYAGPKATDQKNIHRLLKDLESIPDGQRQAHFFCAIAFMKTETDPDPQVFTGRWYGTISRQPIGADGFGYDPVFYLPEMQCTAAELAIGGKNRHSHRARAMEQFRSFLRQGYSLN